jgi:tetratricopeptide (TPR) repeat protein
METEAQQLFQSGADKREKGLYEESIVDFLSALSINPNHLAANYQMVYSLSSLNRLKEALFYANRIVELFPYWDTYEKRAWIKENLGDLSGAEADRNEGRKIPKDDCWC